MTKIIKEFSELSTAIKDKNNVQIAKTFSNNGNGKMNKIFVDEDIEKKNMVRKLDL